MICNNIYSLDSTSNHISSLMNLNFNVSQIVKIKLFNIEQKLPLQMSCISQVMPTLLNHKITVTHSIYSLTIASYL